jgi:hypothetical protein
VKRIALIRHSAATAVNFVATADALLLFVNSATRKVSTVPRYREIKEFVLECDAAAELPCRATIDGAEYPASPCRHVRPPASRALAILDRTSRKNSFGTAKPNPELGAVAFAIRRSMTEKNSYPA